MRSITGEIVGNATGITVMDMEASIEHMSRGTVRHADVLLVVAEPYYRSLETAGRIVPLARGLGIPKIYGVANKIRGRQDEEAVRTYADNHGLEMIATLPYDESVIEADRTGRALIDHTIASPVVAELERVADRLRRESSTGGGKSEGR